jgi:hypothetical protein
MTNATIQGHLHLKSNVENHPKMTKTQLVTLSALVPPSGHKFNFINNTHFVHLMSKKFELTGRVKMDLNAYPKLTDRISLDLEWARG